MNGRRVLAVGCLLLLVLGAGCQGVKPPDSDATPTPTPDHGDRPDPDGDPIGWEAGYWHNESIAVNQSDGLNDSEMDAFVGRAMARVEVVRNREFKSAVPVTVISREEYQNRSGSSPSDAYRAWNNQVWEAMFVVGEDRDVEELLSTTYNQSVLGFYSPSNDEIRIITPTPDRPTMGNATLVHELVHAMQDQYHDIGAARFGPPTQDANLAVSALVEGEANYVESRYSQRCGADWNCAAPPPGGGGAAGPPPNWGITLTVYFPYSDGPMFVDELYERGGWDAVTAAYEDLPASTEQIIHVTDEAPVNVTVRDTARNGWSRFEGQGAGGADVLGEASTYVSFWYQSRFYDAGVVNPNGILDTQNPYDTYNYSAAPTAGWAGDAVVPYERNGSYGYVWKSVWDTPADAREFVAGYRDILRAQDATRGDNGTWVIPDGPFADAFRIERTNETVVVTNAPTRAALDDVHPPNGSVTPTPDRNEATGIPGFGVGVALVAAGLAAAGRAR